jgi:carbon starvation protein
MGCSWRTERSVSMARDQRPPIGTTTVSITSRPIDMIYGHHFAAIAGAGPLVGPVLSALQAMGPIAGIGALLICVIVLAVLALVVVKALIGSPWGAFAVFCTIPIAIFMGIYHQFIRPGHIGEISLIGCVLLLAALIYGKTVSETPDLAADFDLKGETLALIIIGYGFVASVLPAWLLLAPRDYLSRLGPRRR